METHYHIDKESYLEQLRQLEIVKSLLEDSQQVSIEGEKISERTIFEGWESQLHKSVWAENTAYKQLQRELEYYRNKHSRGGEEK